MGKYLKTAYVRNVEARLNKGEISYGNMVELIEIETIRNYKRENTLTKKVGWVFKEIFYGFRIAEENRDKSGFGKL